MTFDTVQSFCKRCQAYHMNKEIGEACNERNQFVKHELYSGGGKLFGYISKDEKEYLNITMDKADGYFNELQPFLNEQRQVWAQWWESEQHRNK